MGQDDPSDARERKRSVAGIFHRASSTYDHVGPGFFAHFGEQLVKHAALPQQARVLDVACGRGAILFPAAEAVGVNGSVIGIDLADGMVEQTSHEAAQRGLKNVEVRQMDAEHLDFPDAEFDVVLCGFALFFFPQLERALAEFRRVLKPGGSLVVSTWGNQFENDREWFNELIKKYLPPQPPSGQKISASNEPDFTTSNGMEKLVRAAGFTDIFIDSEIAHFHYTTKEEWWDTLWSHGVRGRLEAIEKTGGSEALEKLKAESFEQITARMDPKGFQHSFQVLYTCGRKPA